MTWFYEVWDSPAKTGRHRPAEDGASGKPHPVPLADSQMSQLLHLSIAGI